VQTYVYIKHGAVADVESGTYYYHPKEHKLYQFSANIPIPESIFADETARENFRKCGVVLFLIAQLKASCALIHLYFDKLPLTSLIAHASQAIEPLYPDKAQEFSFLEAGYMYRVIEERASQRGIGCEAVLEGEVNSSLLVPLFELEPSHMLALPVLLGGSLPPAVPRSATAEITIADFPIS
jgi:hypothetical protein